LRERQRRPANYCSESKTERLFSVNLKFAGGGTFIPRRIGTPLPRPAFYRHDIRKEADMGKGILLWLLGIPIPIIILLLILWH